MTTNPSNTSSPALPAKSPTDGERFIVDGRLWLGTLQRDISTWGGDIPRQRDRILQILSNHGLAMKFFEGHWNDSSAISFLVQSDHLDWADDQIAIAHPHATTAAIFFAIRVCQKLRETGLLSSKLCAQLAPLTKIAAPTSYAMDYYLSISHACRLNDMSVTVYELSSEGSRLASFELPCKDIFSFRIMMDCIQEKMPNQTDCELLIQLRRMGKRIHEAKIRIYKNLWIAHAGQKKT